MNKNNISIKIFSHSRYKITLNKIPRGFMNKLTENKTTRNWFPQ